MSERLNCDHGRKSHMSGSTRGCPVSTSGSGRGSRTRYPIEFQRISTRWRRSASSASIAARSLVQSSWFVAVRASGEWIRTKVMSPHPSRMSILATRLSPCLGSTSPAAARIRFDRSALVIWSQGGSSGAPRLGHKVPNRSVGAVPPSVWAGSGLSALTVGATNSGS